MIQVRLEEVLKERGKSLYWLAQETQINHNTLHPFAKGKRGAVAFRNLDKICKALNCQPGDLLVHVDDVKRQSR